MTGFGAATGRVGEARVTVELRTVNHRFFSPNIKLPTVFAAWEPRLREELRQRIARGHVTAVVRCEGLDGGAGLINEARFGAYVEQLRALQARHGLADTLDAATVLRLPAVVGGEAAVVGTAESVGGEGVAVDAGGAETGGAAATGDRSAKEFVALVRRAIEALISMRTAEGARLAQLLLDRLTLLGIIENEIGERAPLRLLAERERLGRSVRELAGGIDVDPQRLAQEIAVLADRLDVREELDRFQSHIIAFRDTLASGTSDGVGKRLGFLLQEMVRETNTIGSKARDAAMSRCVVNAKEELERMAEQVENLE